MQNPARTWGVMHHEMKYAAGFLAPQEDIALSLLPDGRVFNIGPSLLFCPPWCVLAAIYICVFVL